ncbi:hypothetical protein P171DRAFT_446609 [Karstenula rhodostoma CBS 690.94]|uniref:Uncharacterized protein n=1 Tax=Karstenula rhodostoma CBS 690.94 TaxID=1392251 RepID=A0A9P4PCV9_9PLEO|nr:hypothetical protein P171DRAFT_446609 [Karstenula rhodostoma CBS 690.94]
MMNKDLQLANAADKFQKQFFVKAEQFKFNWGEPHYQDNRLIATLEVTDCYPIDKQHQWPMRAPLPRARPYDDVVETAATILLCEVKEAQEVQKAMIEALWKTFKGWEVEKEGVGFLFEAEDNWHAVINFKGAEVFRGIPSATKEAAMKALKREIVKKQKILRRSE